MRERGIKRLPVVSDGRLVGILARADLVKVLADALKPRAPLTDTEIRAQLSTELAKQGWIPRAQIDVKVENGVVEYCGTISDPRQRDALRALADTAGATGVHDKLVCIEPISGAVLD
ncbi:MAG: BON domain-containing protein [Rhizomicrobium sp.]